MGQGPSIRDQSEFYDNWNTAHRSGGFDEISLEIRNRGIRILDFIVALNLEAGQTRILEIGCGTGWMTERLEALGQVTAIDLSPEAIEIGRQRGGATEFIADDFFEHDFGDSVFDIVICLETLFYVEDQSTFVEKMASLLHQEGYACVSTINKFVYERRQDIGAPEKGQIRSWLSKRETARLLSREFRIDSVQTVEPCGDLGTLRIINSHKLNALLGALISPQRVQRLKESIGLGGGIVFIARRR